MRRKVIKQGNGTLTITLPKEWTKDVGISGNSEVDLEVNQNNLVINPLGEKKEKSISINVDNFERLSFAKFLIACYEQGFDAMTLVFSKKDVNSWSHGREDVMDVINFFVSRLIGFEILSHTKNSIKIGNIAEKHVKFENIISRIFFLIEEYLNSLSSALKSGEHENLKDAELKHDNIAKMIALASRMLYESESFSKVQSMNHFLILNILDKVTDFVRHSYKFFHTYNKRVNKSSIEIVEKTEEFFKLFRSLYYKFDYSIINQLDELRGDIRKRCMTCKQKHPSESVLSSSFHAFVETLNGAVKSRIALEIEASTK